MSNEWFLLAQIKLYEATCLMRLSYGVEQDISLENAYELESQTAEYFESLIVVDKMTEIDVVPISVRVAVADRLKSGSKTTVNAAVSLLYKSDGKIPLHLETVLSKAMQLTDSNLNQQISFVPEGTSIDYEFQSIENGISILDAESNGRSSTEIGLIVATIFLSLILVAVSSVLLHVTGGWAVFKAKVSNCLFEEVDDYDDEYAYPESENIKSVYPARTESYEDDELEQGDSMLTSAAPEEGSGILGVHRNPAAGLGIRIADDESSMMNDGNTPVSQSSMPVGISSLRKISKPGTPEARGGLNAMIMHRFARSAEKNK